MFPEDFVAKQLLAFTKRGDVVFDPLSGRGTTVFESLVNGRHAFGTDINPVAACVAGAKADPPRLASTLARLRSLEVSFRKHRGYALPGSEFFAECFNVSTLRQIVFLKRQLRWRDTKVDRFIAALVLGCLHGESHKTELCLSNRMPRTISTKPDYSVRWWRTNGYVAPARDVFEVLRRLAQFRLSMDVPDLTGRVALRDARHAAASFPKLKGRVALIVTSPPYLDTTDYIEDQWLRLWFLGGPERPRVTGNTDDRHTSIERYWQFLSEAWKGCAPLAKQAAKVVVRIGGTRFQKDQLMGGLKASLAAGFSDFQVRSLGAETTTEIRNRQTNVFRPGTLTRRYEHDFVFHLS